VDGPTTAIVAFLKGKATPSEIPQIRVFTENAIA
jgi:hypothetical protein